MNKIRGLFEVENFVASTRRWYRQGKPERCRRTPRLPNNYSLENRLEFQGGFCINDGKRGGCGHILGLLKE